MAKARGDRDRDDGARGAPPPAASAAFVPGLMAGATLLGVVVLILLGYMNWQETVPREWPRVVQLQRAPQRLPVTLSADEVRRLLDAASSLRERAMWGGQSAPLAMWEWRHDRRGVVETPSA